MTTCILSASRRCPLAFVIVAAAFFLASSVLVMAGPSIRVDLQDILGGDNIDWQLKVDGDVVMTVPADTPGHIFLEFDPGSTHELEIYSEADPSRFDYELYIDNTPGPQNSPTCTITDPSQVLGNRYVDGANTYNPNGNIITTTMFDTPTVGGSSVSPGNLTFPPWNLLELSLDSLDGGPTGPGAGPLCLDASSTVPLTFEPINLLSGNLEFRENDIAVPCPGIPLSFKRQYNSRQLASSSLGPRWSHTYDITLSQIEVLSGPTNSLITNLWMRLNAGNGSDYFFQSLTNGSYLPCYDCDWKLKDVAGGYSLQAAKGYYYSFNTNGTLTTISNLWGNTLSLSYVGNYPTNRLSQVSHNSLNILDFHYNAQTNLAIVSNLSASIWATFAYREDGAMTNATRHTSAGEYVTTYSYLTNSEIFGVSVLTQRVNSAGDVFSYAYPTNFSPSCTSVVVGTGYYKHTVEYAETNRTVVKYHRTSGSNQVYEYLFDNNLLRVQEIRGPHVGSGMTTRGQTHTVDSSGNITGVTTYDNSTGKSNIVVACYDDHHNPTNISSAYCASPSNRWEYLWDTNYNVMTSATDPEGHKLAFGHTQGLLTSTKVYYEGTNFYETTYTRIIGGRYSKGLISCVTNANKHWVKFEYNNRGYPNSIVPQLGPTVTPAFNNLGHLTSLSLPGDGGPRQYNIYTEEQGWVTNITFPDGLSVKQVHDPMGNVTNIVDTAGRTTRLTYLPSRKLSSVVRVLSDGSARTNSISYDEQFSSLSIKDAKDRVVEAYVLDIEARPTTVTNVENQTMTIGYELGRRPSYINRFDGTVLTNQYDTDGRLWKASVPGITNTFTYYKNNLLKTAANANGTISMFFNSANRLTNTVGVAPSSTVSYAYHPAGQQSNVISIAGTVTYSIDAADRLSALTAPDGKFDYVYNTNNGFVSGVNCTNSGVTVAYAFNDVDLVTGITWQDASSNVLRSFSYQYDDARQITNVVLESGDQLQYTYDDLDQLTGEKRVVSDGTVLYDTSYAYDEVGNRTNKTIDGISLSYKYSYGVYGNRFSGWKVVSGGTLTGKVDVAGSSTETIGTNSYLGQLYVSNAAAWTPEVSTTNFIAYQAPVLSGTQQVVAAIGDVAGNAGYDTNTLVLKVVTNCTVYYNTARCLANIIYAGTLGYYNIASLSWNSLYQLTSVTNIGGAAESYKYDAFGRRTAIISGTITNYLVYDGPHVIAEVNASGVLQKSYTYGPGIDNILAMTDHTTANTYYFLTDHLGSVHAVVDSTGSIVESYRYDAWGKVLGVYDSNDKPLSESAIGNRVLWQGREYSWKTGLYYFRARWYDPITGRWLSKDPIGIAGGLNQYAFCGNNPVNFMDPFGLFTRAELVAIRDSQLAAHGAALQDANAAQTELSKIGYAKAGSTTALSTSAAGSAGALVLTGIPALGIAGAGTSTAAVGGGTALAVPTTTLGGTATIATGTVIPNPVLTSGATAAAVTATRASTGIWNYMRMKGKMVASQQALDSAVAAMEVAMNAARMAQRLIDEYDSESCPK